MQEGMQEKGKKERKTKEEKYEENMNKWAGMSAISRFFGLKTTEIVQK